MFSRPPGIASVSQSSKITFAGTAPYLCRGRAGSRAGRARCGAGARELAARRENKTCGWCLCGGVGVGVSPPSRSPSDSRGLGDRPGSAGCGCAPGVLDLNFRAVAGNRGTEAGRAAGATSGSGAGTRELEWLARTRGVRGAAASPPGEPPGLSFSAPPPSPTPSPCDLSRLGVHFPAPRPADVGPPPPRLESRGSRAAPGGSRCRGGPSVRARTGGVCVCVCGGGGTERGA